MQILPSIVLVSSSNRSELLPGEAMFEPLPIKALALLWFPNLYSPFPWRLPYGRGVETPFLSALPYGQWEFALHLGVTASAASLIGWLANARKWLYQALFWGAILVVMASMGSDGLIYPVLYRWLPGFQQVRIPSRLLWLAFVSWALLAGVDAMANRIPDARVCRAVMIAIFVVGAAWAAGLLAILAARLRAGTWSIAFDWLFAAFFRGQVPSARSVEAFTVDVVCQIAVGSVVVLVCCVALLAWLRSPRPAVAGAFAFVLFAELCAYGYHRNIARWDGFQAVSPMYRALPEPPTGRVIGLFRDEWVFAQNSALCAGVSSAKR